MMLMVVYSLTVQSANGDVMLTRSGSNNRACTIRNDLVSVYIDTQGEITSFLLYQNGDGDASHSVQLTTDKGYFSVANSGGAARLSVNAFYVKVNTSDMVEVQYVTPVIGGFEWVIGYVVRRGVAGVYHYVQANCKADGSDYSELRMGFRGDASLFNYAYVNDDLQDALPTPADIASATEVTDATYRLADGSIYTKYDYAAFQKDDYVHGMMGDHVGLWMITPSVEWLNGGPMRQDLTVHATNTTPIALRHFHGNHFGGVSVYMNNGQSKYYGPHLIYANYSNASSVATAHSEMVADAKQRAAVEQSAWPYNWLRDESIKKRGTVIGQITLSAEDAAYFKTTKLQVILAQPGSKPMLQGTGYQFWTETDASGNFTINNVREGSYSLYAYALNGAATGYYEKADVAVTANATTSVGTLTWTPDKYGDNSKILWKIGEADHLSMGKLSGEKRQYGLWNDVPEEVNYTVGSSNLATDWYYAQAHNGNWYIKYQLDDIPTNPLRLTVATAGAANASMKVRSNENRSTYGIGLGNQANEVFRPKHDGSVTRSATLAGRDSVAVFYIPVSTLKKGENYLNLNLWGISENGAGGIMYDMIKLESNEPQADETPIIALTAEPYSTATDSPYYNLSGQRVAKPAKGIYIVNGKKIIIK
jgi:rhamnogalacturonan endolyase